MLSYTKHDTAVSRRHCWSFGRIAALRVRLQQQYQWTGSQVSPGDYCSPG